MLNFVQFLSNKDILYRGLTLGASLTIPFLIFYVFNNKMENKDENKKETVEENKKETVEENKKETVEENKKETEEQQFIKKCNFDQEIKYEDTPDKYGDLKNCYIIEDTPEGKVIMSNENGIFNYWSDRCVSLYIMDGLSKIFVVRYGCHSLYVKKTSKEIKSKTTDQEEKSKKQIFLKSKKKTVDKLKEIVVGNHYKRMGKIEELFLSNKRKRADEKNISWKDYKNKNN